jgi:hypothetical protein
VVTLKQFKSKKLLFCGTELMEKLKEEGLVREEPNNKK